MIHKKNVDKFKKYNQEPLKLIKKYKHDWQLLVD